MFYRVYPLAATGQWQVSKVGENRKAEVALGKHPGMDMALAHVRSLRLATPRASVRMTSTPQ